MLEKIHCAQERTNPDRTEGQTVLLCGLEVMPPVTSALNGVEVAGPYFMYSIAATTCEACKAEYKRLYPEKYAEMEAKKIEDAKPRKTRWKGRTDPGHDYGHNDPIGWCGDPRRGAAHGRCSYHAADPLEWTGKLWVSQVHLDNGGYDPNGTYFGWS